jgi:hypothetical protein
MFASSDERCAVNLSVMSSSLFRNRSFGFHRTGWFFIRAVADLVCILILFTSL